MNDINDIAAEAAVLASIIQNPDMYFVDTNLEPRHFFEEQNGYLYYALGALIKRGSTIDAFNIMQVLSQNSGTKKRADELLSVAAINDFISTSPSIARRNVEDYRLASGNIIKTALKRTMYGTLTELQNLCLSDQYQEDFEQEVYNRLDGVIKDYTISSDIAELGDTVDDIWEEIESRRRGEVQTILFPFDALNQFVTLEAGTTCVFSASKKQGKSMLLTTLCLDLLRKGLSVVFVDSEISDSIFVKRALSNLTGIPFGKIKYGTYTEEEKQRLIEAKDWLKQQKLIHKYTPILESQWLSLTAKRAMYAMDGFDVLIVDYLKADSRSDDAYSVYANLGKISDCIHEIAGTLKIPVIAAAQSTDQGNRIADSAKIARNADTVVLVMQKTPEEIERDGPECGNKKFFIYANRNGPQMQDFSTEYIDMCFEGNVCRYRQADKQHQIEFPY